MLIPKQKTELIGTIQSDLEVSQEVRLKQRSAGIDFKTQINAPFWGLGSTTICQNSVFVTNWLGYLCNVEIKRFRLICNFGVSLSRHSQLKHRLNLTDKIKSKRHEDGAGQGERQSDGGSMRVGQPKPGSSRGLAFTEASH